MNEWIFETSDKDFERDVIERSNQVPVVVDFWATWCEPCKTLGPVLEKLTTEHAGAFVLVKVDTDKNQQIAAAIGIRSVPTVMGLRDGKVMAQFVGALPEEEIREFLAKVLPSEAELLTKEAEQRYAAGEKAEAEEIFRRALELDSHCDPALVGLARALADREEDAEAVQLLERVSAASPLRQEADRLTVAIRVSQPGATDVQGCRDKVRENPDDLAARIALGHALAASGNYGSALEEYLQVVKRNRAYEDEAARKAMLDIFELLGAGDETAEHYRGELAKVLFS